MRKRVSAFPPKILKSGNSEGNSKSSMEPRTSLPVINTSVTTQQAIKSIDPSCCIPLFLVRNRINNAVKKLKAIFTGSASNYSGALCGFVSGKPTSVVVPLVGELESYIVKFLMSKGYAEKDADVLKKKRKVWYGVIDGCQVLEALLELKDEFPHDWGDFKWTVIVVMPNHEIEEYRQLARIENERNKQFYHYECTVYDLLRGLRLEYDFLYEEALKKSRTGKRGAKVNHRDVAQRYDGGDHINNTSVKQAVTVASRISKETVETIGKICNKECADIMIKDPKYNKYNFKMVDDILAVEDCRLFRSFLCFGSLRGSKGFMNAMLDGHEQAQVNTIYRVQHWSELNQYRSVQSKVITDQFNLAMLSLKEEKKFLSIIEEEKWPDNMETCRENTLRTTLSDKELMLNNGNDGDVLPSIWSCFKRLYPAKARAIESIVDSSSESEEETPVPPGLQKDDERESNEVKKADQQRQEELKRKKEQLVKLKQNRDEADQNLNDTGIYTYQMNFDSFSTQIWSSDSKRVDLVISSIPKEINEEKLANLPHFCKRVLKTGSYGFFIVTEEQFSFLKRCFKDHEFKVIDRSFKIMYDITTIQRRAMADFPQKDSDIAIMVKTTGHHPDGFSPIFSDAEASSNLDLTTKFASVINIKACQDLLRKPKENKAVTCDEKSVELFSHIIKMLTPPNGSVIDPIAGALTATISCIRSGRKCIAVEDSEEIFRFAIGRTRVHITPTATMQNMADYMDPIELDDEDTVRDTEPPVTKKRELATDLRNHDIDAIHKRQKINTEGEQDTSNVNGITNNQISTN